MMKSAAQTVYERELENQVEQRDKVMKRMKNHIDKLIKTLGIYEDAFKRLDKINKRLDEKEKGLGMRV